MPKSTVLLVGTGSITNYTAQALRDFGYRVLQPGTPDECLALMRSDKPQLVICEDPCLLANGSTLFDSLKANAENDGTKYLSLTTLTAAVADKSAKTERTGYLIKPFYLEQAVMEVRWLIGNPDDTVPAAA